MEDFNYNLGLIRERDKELTSQDEKKQALEKELKKTSDYDELKSQLEQALNQLKNVQHDYQTIKIDYRGQLHKQAQLSGDYEKSSQQIEQLKS